MNNEKLMNLDHRINEERSKLVTDRLDISFGEIISMYINQEIVIRPEYQRLFRWTSQQKTALIESILMGIPIPPIFVAEDEEGVWELVDGLQRISTILSFFGELRIEDSNTVDQQEDSYQISFDDYDSEFNLIENSNSWSLEAGSLISELEGLTWRTLPRKYQLNIKRAVCRVEILREKSNISMKYELFKRLNSGGSSLTAQEIRNAIYRGIDDKLNSTLEKLCKNEIFIQLTNLSKKKRYQLYDQELVLRFIAYYDNVHNINMNTEAFLDNYVEKVVMEHNFDSNKFENLFIESVELINSLDDSKVFKNNRNTFVPALFEGIMIGVAHNFQYYKENKDILRNNINELKEDENFKHLSGSSSNSRSRVKSRLKRVLEIFAPKEK